MKLKYFNQWRKNSIIKSLKIKQRQNVPNPKIHYELYEDYKMRETYLTALNILYQIKEADNYPFQPNVNKNYFNFYNQNQVLSNRIKKINNRKKIKKSTQRLSKSFSLSNHSKYLNNNEKKVLKKYKEQKEKKNEKNINNYYLNTYHTNSNFTNFKKNIKIPIQKSKLTKPINFFNKSNDYKTIKNQNFNQIKINKDLNINKRYHSFKILEQPNLYIITNTKPSVELSTKVSSPKSIKNTKNEENNYQKTKQLYNQFLSQRGNKKNSSSINFPSDKTYLQENFKKGENSKSNKSIKLPVFSYLMDKNSIEKNSTIKSGPYIIYDNLNNFSDSISTLKNSKDLNIKNNFFIENNSKLKSHDSSLNKEKKFKNLKNLKLNLQDLNERKSNDKNDNNKNYFIYSDNNFVLKSNYSQSSGLITLQSVSDKKLFNQANDYLTSDRSLKSFKRHLNKNKKRKKSQIKNK